MLIPAPSTSLTQPSGWAKALVRGEGDGRPGAVVSPVGELSGVRPPGYSACGVWAVLALPLAFGCVFPVVRGHSPCSLCL